MSVSNSDRLYKKARVIIHANLAFSMLIGQLIFVFGIDTAPKVRNLTFFNHKFQILNANLSDSILLVKIPHLSI